MGLPIPEIRVMLEAIAQDADPYIAARIRKCTALTYRNPATTRAPITSNKVTPEIVKQVLKIHKKDPDLQQKDIGAMVNINQGRVCEILNGKRNSEGVLIR